MIVKEMREMKERQIALVIAGFLAIGTLLVLGLNITGNVVDAPTDGLILYYDFDGDVLDRSGNGNNGVASGAIHDPEGKFGGAYYFDGIDDFIEVGDITDLDGASAMSISVWHKFPSPEGFDDDEYTIVSKRGAFIDGGFSFLYDPVQNRFESYLDEGGRRSGEFQYSRSLGVEDDTWYHIVLSFNGTHTLMYSNGFETDTDFGPQTTPFSILANDVILEVGGDPSDSSAYLKGHLDELRIYDRALSPDEILQIYSLGIESSVCTDSDGGLDIFVKGYTEINGGSRKNDACATFTGLNEEGVPIYRSIAGTRGTPGSCSGEDCFVTERACDLDSAKLVQIACPEGCVSGLCNNGVRRAIEGECGESINSCLGGVFNDLADSASVASWECQGEHGGNSVSCSSPILINGACGVSKDNCLSGDFNDVSDSSTDYLWKCVGINGGEDELCSTPLPATAGVCSETINSCSTGSFIEVSDNSTNYIWKCSGVNGGAESGCSHPIPSSPVEGLCGNETNTCLAGSLEDIGDNSENYLWNCNGLVGGESASCSVEIPCVSQITTTITPATCPESGKQTRITNDTTCRTIFTSEEISCTPNVCSGCSSGNSCYAFGERVEARDIDQYCDVDGLLKDQKEAGLCQNNYECSNNLCSSGECLNLEEEIRQRNVFREVVLQILCSILNPISSEERTQCFEDLTRSIEEGN